MESNSKQHQGKANRRPIWVMLAPVVVVALIVGGIYALPNLPGRSSQQFEQELEAVVAQTQEMFDELNKLDEGGVPATSTKVFAGSETATGSMKVVSDFMATNANRAIKYQNDYVEGLKEAGWFEMLNAERLKADSDLSGAYLILSDARDVLARHLEKTNGLQDKIIDEIDRLPFESEAFRRGFKAEFIRSYEFAIGETNKIAALEEKSLNEVGQIIDLLKAHEGSWRIENNQVMFDDGLGADSFNQHLANIKEFVEEQRRIQQALLDRQRQQLAEALD